MKREIFCIAEIGQAHDGSLGILHSYIDAISKTGVNAIKFQTHIAEAESSQEEPFRVNFSYEDKTRFDYWNRMSFSSDQWQEIKVHCEEKGLEFMSSPFSIAAVELLETIGIKRYKVGSGELSNYLMLDKIGRTGKPIILSSGMSSYEELKVAVEFLKPYGNELAILQCTTSYPTAPENIGLNVITELKLKFPGLTIGLSDHSGTIYPGIAAVALGAEIVEFHAVFDKRMFGPDASSSLTIEEIAALIEGVRYVEKAINFPVDKDDLKPYAALKVMFGKSLALNKDLLAGHVINQDDLESKKPGDMGIPANDYKAVLGKVLIRDKSKYDFLQSDDLQNT